MKKLTTAILLMIALAIPAFGQHPTEIIYGQREGEKVYVHLGKDFHLQVWAVSETDVGLLYLPLATNDSVITSRDGGTFHFPLTEWDEAIFTDPQSNIPVPFFTNQSILAACDLGGDPNPWLNTNGATVLIAEFFMRATDDVDYLYQRACPFVPGSSFNPENETDSELTEATTPLTSYMYSCLFFVDYYAGDANGSGTVNGLDVTYLVAYIKGNGPDPDPLLSGDANGDCQVNGLDVSYLINYSKGGSEPYYGDCY